MKRTPSFNQVKDEKCGDISKLSALHVVWSIHNSRAVIMGSIQAPASREMINESGRAHIDGEHSCSLAVSCSIQGTLGEIGSRF